MKDKLIKFIDDFDDVVSALGSSCTFNRILHLSLIFGSVAIASDPVHYGYIQPFLQATGQLINQPK